jgi:hypothetical protein
MFYGDGMDWDLAIERHRDALLRIVLALFALVGLGQGGGPERLPSPLYRAVLRVLRPAEAAVRRLIVVAARGLVVKPSPSRPTPKRRGRKGQGRRAFQLVDPRRRRAEGDGRRYAQGPRPEPRLHFFDVDPRSPLFRAPPPIAPQPAASVNAQPLCRRLAAIKAALAGLAAQARRYARWRARPVEQRRPKLVSSLRPGLPPGYRRRPSHAVDAILRDCHWLACTLPQPDTS